MIKIENKNPIFNNGYISTTDMKYANRSESDRSDFSQLATITRNKLKSKNPEKLFNRLKAEAANNTPSRPTEFIPVKLYIEFWNGRTLLKDMNTGNVIEMLETIEDKIHFYNNLMPFSYIEQKEEYNILYTNLRASMNYGMEYNKIPFNSDCSDFKCIIGKVPKFVYDHLITHTQLSTESSSLRINGKKEVDMWYSEDEKLENILKKQDISVFNNCLEINKNFNYNKELALRDISSRRYVNFVMTGWKINPKSWDHLFDERGANKWKNWTQSETKEVVKLIKEVL